MDAPSDCEPQPALVALGGNEGDVSATFHCACDELNQLPAIDIKARSSEYSSPAVGPAAGASFLNAAVLLRTTLAPLQLLDVLQQAESRHGRVRTVRWGPRTLDLDLLCHGQTVLDTPRLTLPHPACWYRRFVLDPVVEIAGDYVHPVFELPFRELRDRLLPRPLPVAVAADAEAWKTIDDLRPEFPQVRWIDADGPDLDTAAIVLRMTESAVASPFTIDVPAETRRQFVHDVLHAALGE